MIVPVPGLLRLNGRCSTGVIGRTRPPEKSIKSSRKEFGYTAGVDSSTLLILVGKLEHAGQSAGRPQAVKAYGVAAENQVDIVPADIQCHYLPEAPAPDIHLVPHDALLEVLAGIDGRVPAGQVPPTWC